MLAVTPSHAQRLVAISMCVLIGCAHTSPDSRAPAPATALLLPIVWIPTPPADSDRVDALIVERWSEVPRLDLRAGDESVDSACADDLACLQRLGREASVDTLVLYRVGRLGTTTVIRIQTFDVEQAAMEQTVQSILEDEVGDGVDAGLLAATDQLAAFYQAPTPWYERPAVWIAAAATVVAGVLTLFLVARDDEPDISVVPPPPG